jgi:hypothetical protein
MQSLRAVVILAGLIPASNAFSIQTHTATPCVSTAAINTRSRTSTIYTPSTRRASYALNSHPNGNDNDNNNDNGELELSQSLDSLLEKGNLKSATSLLKHNPNSIQMTKERILSIFNAVEERTKEAEENAINKRAADEASVNLGAMEYPPTSPARMEMTEMYSVLNERGDLRVFGAARDGKYPAMGTKNVTPNLLEKITDLSMNALTPKPTNTLLLAGAGLAFVEGILSLSTGINLNFLILLTLFLGFLDKLIVNGAVFETATRVGMPEYRTKILKHEAGHFLCAYLLGCPVEGCVLSTWAALADPRFGGKRTTVNAGTSFFDPSLSNQINGREPLTRASIDRYSIVVMAGIAAEGINFGEADGGAGDEMALVTFLQNLNPRNGGAVSWNTEKIKTQARWGALQSVLLLRQYRVCYDALVDALERGGELGECVYAIENAVKENGLPSIADKPLGYIADRGPYGEWITTDIPDFEGNMSATSTTVTSTREEISDSTAALVQEEVLSLEELKQRMQTKLKEIDSQLDDL